VSPRLLPSAFAFALALTLACCGKAGSPTVPGSAFPLPYPNPKLSPTQTAAPTAPEDQPGMQAGNQAKFTDKGSYIDPSVKDTELRRGAVAAGSTLPNTQTTSPGSNTPFNQNLGIQGASPLGSTTGTTPPDDEQNPP
jgi:hypothetical protein